MEIYSKIDPARLNGLVDRIRAEYQEWKVVNVVVEKPTGVDMADVAALLNAYFSEWDGYIFVCNDKKVLILGRLGKEMDMRSLEQGVGSMLPEYQCDVAAGKITKEGMETFIVSLKEIMLHLVDSAESKQTKNKTSSSLGPKSGLELLKKRQARNEKVFFVVEDDMFMRTLLTRALEGMGTVHTFADSPDVVAAYQQHLPDVVFLDIHLPSASGLTVLGDLMAHDTTAGVIILSADTVKDNILLAQASGAKGFMAKPFTKDRVLESVQKCVDQAALLLTRST